MPQLPGSHPKPNHNPALAVVIWKGGARERADDVFFALGIKRRRSKADFAPTWVMLTKKIPKPKDNRAEKEYQHKKERTD